jgi:hypothetical protein
MSSKRSLPDVVAHELGGQLLRGQDAGMDAHDQDLFVVRAVEDPMRPRSGSERLVRHR